MTTSDKHNPVTPSAKNTETAPAVVPISSPATKPSVKKAPTNPKAAATATKTNNNADKVSKKSEKSAPKATAAKSPVEKNKPPVKAPAGEKAPTAKKAPASKVKAASAKSEAASAIKPTAKRTVKKAAPSATISAPAQITSKPTETTMLVATPIINNETIASQTTNHSLEPVAKKSKTTQLLAKSATKNPKSADIASLVQHKLMIYSQLMRLDRPIGILLLLWPTLWSLWLAAKGMPSLKNLLIFSLGVVIMRSAGCVINDFADRKIDSKVKRTQDRPLATGAVSNREAIMLFVVLCLLAFGLVLLTNPLTIKLSAGGLLLAFCYPFMKRHTHLPQIVLGAAFAWSIPMAFAAEAGELTQNLWLIYLAVVLWTVAYDTFYAMLDRDDDIKIGVKSTAILFGEQDRFLTGVLQAMALYTLFIIGDRFELGGYYYTSVVVAAGLFAYQQWLIRFRARAACFNAFLNNNWVGLTIFVGIAADFALR